MTAIATLSSPVLPAGTPTLGADLAARFAADTGLELIPVVDDGRVVGLVSRWSLAAAAPAVTAADLMETEPLCVDADLNLVQAVSLIEARSAPTLGLVVLSGETYIGVCSLRSLVTAGAAMAAREDEAWDGLLETFRQEVRKPLDGLMAMTELLGRQPLNPDARAQVRTLSACSTDLVRTLNKALEMSRTFGVVNLNLRPTALRGLMDEVQAEWQARAAEQGATLLISYDGEDVEAMIDAVRIRQVFDTLIEHGLKRSGGGIEAGLKARRTPGGLILEGRVRDSGPALAAEHLARIFEPQSDGSGGGLGLALSRRILESMNGSVRAEENIGAGASILFDLMVDEAQAPAPDQQSAEPGGRTAHVLVVDDNATNRMVAEALCEMFDCTSECAEDGVEALEAAQSGRFDLILMDIKMPRMDGVEATRAIRALGGRAAATPIIALTANADPEDARAYIAAGMNAVVEKPIKPEKLLAAMNAVLPGGPTDQAAAA